MKRFLFFLSLGGVLAGVYLLKLDGPTPMERWLTVVSLIALVGLGISLVHPKEPSEIPNRDGYETGPGP